MTAKKKNEKTEENEKALPYFEWYGVNVALPPFNIEVVVTNALEPNKTFWATYRHNGKNGVLIDEHGFVKDAPQFPEVTHWMFIEPVDLSTAHDIDWSKSVAEIDQQLYKKYGLTQDEIDFIESHVKPME